MKKNKQEGQQAKDTKKAKSTKQPAATQQADSIEMPERINPLDITKKLPIQNSSSIVQDFRRSDWLYNPVIYTQISGDFTLMQQRVFIGVVEKLQDRIMESIDLQKQTKQWPMLFSKEEMGENIDIRIDARSLGVTPERYPELKQALEQLMGMKFGYVKHRGKTTTYEMGVLFHYIAMDIPDELVRRKGEMVPRTRSTGKIRIKMDKDNVNNFLSMAGGYTMHLARIAQICKKKRTPRIYIFLSFYRDSPQGKSFDYKDFCAFLGIDDDSYVANCIERLSKQLKNEEITKTEFAERRAAIKETDNPFHKYNKVKSLVLEPSKKELDELCQQGQVDFTFTYEAVYENGRKKGNPDKIMFHMEKGRMGLERDRVVKEHNQQQYLMNKLVERYEGLDIFELMPLVRRVPTNKFEAFRDYCLKELPVLFEKAHRDRPANYVLTVIENWILALEKEQQEQEQQEQEARMQEIQEEAKVRWEGCRKIILQKVTNDESIRIFRSLRFEKFDLKEHALVLQVESRDDFDWLEQEVVIKQLLEPAIGKYFGKDSKLLYRIMKA